MDSGQLSGAASVPILARAHSHRFNAYTISALRQDRDVRHAHRTWFEILITPEQR